MSEGSLSESERERLEEIASLDLTSREIDDILQQIVARCASRFGLPISLVSIVLDQAQYFAAFEGIGGHALAARGTPIEWSFCRHSVESKEPFIVEDAESHPMVKDNDAVVNQGIRCYAGIPLITSRGHAIGTLCVAGLTPRTFSQSELDILHDESAEAIRRIEERRDRKSRRKFVD